MVCWPCYMTPSIRSSSVYRRHGLQSYIVQVYQFVDVVTLNVYIYHHFLISKPTNNGANDTGPGCTVGRKWENKFLSNSLFSIWSMHLLIHTWFCPYHFVRQWSNSCFLISSPGMHTNQEIEHKEKIHFHGWGFLSTHPLKCSFNDK